MARLRFGDQSVPKVTRVATGWWRWNGSLGGMSDVDLTDASQGGLARRSSAWYMTQQQPRFVATNVLNNITVTAVALNGIQYSN